MTDSPQVPAERVGPADESLVADAEAMRELRRHLFGDPKPNLKPTSTEGEQA